MLFSSKNSTLLSDSLTKQSIVFIVSAILLILLVSSDINAQEQASAYFDSPACTPFVQYAILSGRIQLPFVLNQPYTSAEILQSVGRIGSQSLPAWQQHWLRLIAKEISTYHRVGKGESEAYGYLGGQGIFRGISKDNSQSAEYRAELEGKFTAPWFVLAQKTVLDQHFKTDPNYFGDTGEWIYGRVETGYMMVRYRGAGFFLGRISRNWGLPGEKSLILSDNPYSYDTAGLQLGSRRFRFSFLTTRLNDMIAIDTQAKSPAYQRYNRFWAIKRFDLSLSPNLQFGLSEAAVYGGVNGTWQMIYLNPLNLYYIEQRNNRVQMDGLWCADLFWKPSSYITFYGQYLIDDLIINNEPGQNDRGKHPDRMGVTAKIVLTDVAAPGSQIGLSYTRIGNWTYMSYRNYENYISNGMGMGYPDNSIEEVAADISWFGCRAWVMQLRGGYARQGSQDMTIPFGDTRDKFPIGVVSYRTRGEASLAYVPSNYWDVRLVADYDHLDSPVVRDDFRISAILHVKRGWLGEF